MLVSALAIPGSAQHVRAAREFAALVMRVHAVADDGTVGLLLSELLANSIRHSDSGKPGGTITVTVALTPEAILAEVADAGGEGVPVLREAQGVEAESGRGLRLVQELSDDWGYSGGTGQLATWFELKTGQPS